jgi:hypothetical protein
MNGWLNSGHFSPAITFLADFNFPYANEYPSFSQSSKKSPCSSSLSVYRWAEQDHPVGPGNKSEKYIPILRDIVGAFHLEQELSLI